MPTIHIHVGSSRILPRRHCLTISPASTLSQSVVFCRRQQYSGKAKIRLLTRGARNSSQPVMACPINDLRAFLLGSWRISRRIQDFRLGISGRFEGRVMVAPAATGIVHEETGKLSFGIHQGEATRRTLIAIGRPEAAALYHADGSLFHALDLSSGTADILHRCADDHYRGRYRVLHGNCFWVSWYVTGPRKQYRLAIRHVRMAPDS
ncbi:MAG: DUF6314 family protein [Rhizomicrobium sp.]